MKKSLKLIIVITLIAVMVITVASCSKSGGGGKSLNSVEDLKAYLDKQPANSPDKPLKIAMKLNEPMFQKVKEVINEAGKYVSLDLSGSPTTTIPDNAFKNCKLLAGIIIPNGVTIIGGNNDWWEAQGAFYGCVNLASVTIPDSVTDIGLFAFAMCTSLTSITIPASVTSISGAAFSRCNSLTSVTFQGTINYFGNKRNDGSIISPFDGDLDEKYLSGGVGTYTTTAPVGDNSKWTKQ